MAIGSRIYSHRLTTCNEDFDDALMLLDFGDDQGRGQGEGLIAQLQVTRNHVSGYRGETVIYGEQGLIRIGSFNQKLLEVNVEAYGRRDATEPIATRKFEMRRYGQPLPEFIDRYGAAYKQELKRFLECCRDATPFPITHLDGLRAQEIVAAAMSASVQKKDMSAISYKELQ
jgi:predicted dehydrogenase